MKKNEDQIFAYMFDALLLVYGNMQNTFCFYLMKKDNRWNHKNVHRDLSKNYVCHKVTYLINHISIS